MILKIMKMQNDMHKCLRRINEMKKRKENRIVVIDNKRICDICDVEITEDIQDSGRTLKLFIKKKKRKDAK
mgnify:CR=1 FL=1